MRVMTYNVGGWYTGSGSNVPAEKKNEYYALQTGMITRNDPDILVIEEYLANFSNDGTSALSMLQGLFPYVHTETSGTYFGRAVCSKYPISDYVKRQFSKEPSRYFDSCTVTVDDIPYTVVVTHLGLTQANRTPEISQLIEFLKTQETFICGGDFNTDIVDQSSTEMYENNVEPFLDEGFKSANFTDFGFLVTCAAAPSSEDVLCIDNIYTSSDIHIFNAYVDKTKLYDGLQDRVDHMPLIADLYTNMQPKPFDFHVSFMLSNYQRFTGLSTDEKPTPQGNAVFLELDTGETYYYKNGEWSIQG